ncbi:uncharacterized protein [Epargyreus clarus]|uniref:uncharacterized protein n=1 Tax=Epargyreus clarus TaxID=520877 RepID=UPI003C3050E9
MTLDVKDLWCLRVVEGLDDFCKKLDEKIDNEQQQVKARRKKNQLECKMAQEMKINSELTQQLAEISRRCCELDRVCASFESCLTIADSDRNRLDNAKETYQIAKELTGIRFDYTAPPDVAKGYVKSEKRRLLQAFEQPAAAAALWARVRAAAATEWPVDKENRPDNK